MRYPSGHDSPNPLIGLVPICLVGGGLALGSGGAFLLLEADPRLWLLGAPLPFLGAIAGRLTSRRVLREVYAAQEPGARPAAP